MKQANKIRRELIGLNAAFLSMEEAAKGHDKEKRMHAEKEMQLICNKVIRLLQQAENK